MPSRTHATRTHTLGRRAMLEHTVVGGAAVAAGLLTVESPTAAALTQSGADAGIAGVVTRSRMRRVTTGLNGEGQSFIAGDETVGIADLWRTSADRPLGAGPAGELPVITSATGGSRCFIAMLPPSTDPMPSLENRVGFHRTGGVAYCLLLTGEVVFLVDVEEVRLTAGDLVVERGTDHSWRNEGAEPVALLVVVVEGEARA
ncbi:MAG: cupin domain-containing protein [Acidobacteria bacterium]|nr:cupin domain-containing protein [Acidobacteriota bacterium]